MKNYLVFTVLKLLSVSSLISSQVETEIRDNANTTKEVLPSSINLQNELEICNEHDKISKTYCNCVGGVVNCDFSKFATQQSNNAMELSISGFAIPIETRRVCICNTPSDLSLTFTKTFLPISNKIHRFDLYNLKGVTILDGGFSMNFNGDLYISNLTMIPEIRSYEFGRGDDSKIPNLQDVACCSLIKVNQKFKKPVLFIENTAIGAVHTGGISDLHLWKTVILKSVNINQVQYNGISSNNPQTDIAIIGSAFKTVADSGINFEQASNLFMAKTYFITDANTFAWSSKSTLKNSNLVLLGNTFWYPVIHGIDAKRIVSWNNIYLTWDNYTFSNMQQSSFKERFISIKYNVIYYPNELIPQSFQFSNGSRAVLMENVLGSCSCSRLHLLKNPVLTRDVNRCFAGNISNTSSGKCSLKLEAVMKVCTQSSAPNFNEMCRDKSIATNSTFPGVRTDVTTSVEKASVKTNFITSIINEYNTLIGINYLATLDGFIGTSQDPWEDENSARSGGSSAAATVVIVLTVFVCCACMGERLIK